MPDSSLKNAGNKSKNQLCLSLRMMNKKQNISYLCSNEEDKQAERD